MTTEQFNKKSCELIERIQDLETEVVLAKYALEGLREAYKKEVEEKQVERFVSFAEQYNNAIKEAAADAK